MCLLREAADGKIQGQQERRQEKTGKDNEREKESQRREEEVEVEGSTGPATSPVVAVVNGKPAQSASVARDLAPPEQLDEVIGALVDTKRQARACYFELARRPPSFFAP